MEKRGEVEGRGERWTGEVEGRGEWGEVEGSGERERREGRDVRGGRTV